MRVGTIQITGQPNQVTIGDKEFGRIYDEFVWRLGDTPSKRPYSLVYLVLQKR